MRIIHHGKRQDYIYTRRTCPCCGTVYEFDQTEQQRSYGIGAIKVWTECPVCHAENTEQPDQGNHRGAGTPGECGRPGYG